MTAETPYLLAALAWSALWAQVVVIPFYRKDEDNFSAWTGRRDAVFARIDAERTVPALAQLFEKVKKELDSRVKKTPALTAQDVLEELDLLIYLKVADDANAEKLGIRTLIDALATLARRLWKWGLMHCVAAVAIGLVFVCMNPGDYRDVSVGAAAAASGITLTYTIVLLVRYERSKKSLFGAMSKYQGNAS